MQTIAKEMGRASAKDATPTIGGNDTAARFLAMRCSVVPSYAVYESLKATLTADAATPAEYEHGCRQAADLAGV